jgi:hypothetical protein
MCGIRSFLIQNYYSSRFLYVIAFLTVPDGWTYHKSAIKLIRYLEYVRSN